ncbi:hypothetical protein WA016_00786 [Myxococcus stipitatus]
MGVDPDFIDLRATWHDNPMAGTLTDALKKLLGCPPLRFDTWAQEHAAPSAPPRPAEHGGVSAPEAAQVRPLPFLRPGPAQGAQRPGACPPWSQRMHARRRESSPVYRAPTWPRSKREPDLTPPNACAPRPSSFAS